METNWTGRSPYFEDLEVGMHIRHGRGRTVCEAEHQMLTNLVMNTAQLHFNQAMVDAEPSVYYGGKRVVYGGCVLAWCVGLASEDTSGNAIAELRYDEGKHTQPVFAGDTLFAESIVLAMRPSDRTDAGIVKFKLLGKNQKHELVLEIEREILLRRRPTGGT